MRQLGKLNFVDRNNLVVGVDEDGDCCSSSTYHFRKNGFVMEPEPPEDFLDSFDFEKESLLISDSCIRAELSDPHGEKLLLVVSGTDGSGWGGYAINFDISQNGEILHTGCINSSGETE